MNYKTTLIMAIIFAVGVASVLLLNKSDEKKEKLEELEGKLLNVVPDSIQQVILQPSNISMQRTGDQWQILTPINTNGDNSAINSLVNMFDWAKIERTISSDPSEYSQYGLDPDHGRMIVKSNSATDTLYLGAKSPTGSFVFARKSGTPEVFLTTTSLETNIQKKLYDLRDKKVISYDEAALQKLVITSGKRDIELVKDGADWQIETPVTWPADATIMNELTNRLHSENAKEYIDEDPSSLNAYGLNNPFIKIDLYLGQDQGKKSLLIGKRSGDKYYALDDTRKPVFMVDSSFVKKFEIDDIASLRNKKIANYTTEDVNKVELEYGDLNLTCVKDTAETWYITSMDSAKAKTWKISAMIRAVTSLKIEKFVNDNPSSLRPFGLDKPQVDLKLYNNDHLLTELKLGNESGNNQYFTTTDRASVYLCDRSKFVSLKPKLDEILEEAPATTTAEQP